MMDKCIQLGTAMIFVCALTACERRSCQRVCECIDDDIGNLNVSECVDQCMDDIDDHGNDCGDAVKSLDSCLLDERCAFNDCIPELDDMLTSCGGEPLSGTGYATDTQSTDGDNYSYPDSSMGYDTSYDTSPDMNAIETDTGVYDESTFSSDNDTEYSTDTEYEIEDEVDTVSATETALATDTERFMETDFQTSDDSTWETETESGSEDAYDTSSPEDTAEPTDTWMAPPPTDTAVPTDTWIEIPPTDTAHPTDTQMDTYSWDTDFMNDTYDYETDTD